MGSKAASKTGRISGAIGEMKNRTLRALGELTGWEPLVRSSGGRLISMYSLSSNRVDYQLARELYYNQNDNYKLGGGFSKPIINAAVGFIGVPKFRVETDEMAETTLERFVKDNISKMQQTHRDAIRDGKCYVRLTRDELVDNNLYPERNAIIRYHIIPVENVTEIKKHPLTGHPIEYVIETQHDRADGHGQVTVVQKIRADTIEIECDGPAPEGLTVGTKTNTWGFIPIVEFANETEAYENEPKSDLEGVEPFIKVYHDVFLHAIQGSKLHSTPRLKLKLKDVAGFLANNFGVDDPRKFIESGGEIDLENRDLLIFTHEEEDAEFVEVESAIGSAEPLLHLLFYCIVEHSETPEFCFGAHLPANYASVKEQMPVLVRRVKRKREFFDEPWRLLGRLVLTMTSMAEAQAFSTHNTELDWDEVDPRDEAEVAQELRNTIIGLTMAVEKRILSRESAINYLGRIIDTMSEYSPDEGEGEWDRIRRDIEDINELTAVNDEGDGTGGAGGEDNNLINPDGNGEIIHVDQTTLEMLKDWVS